MEYLKPKKEHDRMVSHAKELLKTRDECKWEICKIALEVCYIPPRKGGRYKDKYSITNFAEDIGLNRKTLSCWILDYQSIAKPLGLDKLDLTFSERKRISGSIQRTRAELFNFNNITREEINKVSKEEVLSVFTKHQEKDVLQKRLEDFLKYLRHHYYCFTHETFNENHEELINEYLKLSSQIKEAIKKRKVV